MVENFCLGDHCLEESKLPLYLTSKVLLCSTLILLAISFFSFKTKNSVCSCFIDLENLAHNFISLKTIFKCPFINILQVPIKLYPIS